MNFEDYPYVLPMSKLFTFAMAAVLGSTAFQATAQETVYDFVPTVEQIIFQELIDNDTDELTTQVRIEVLFPDEVWWVGGFGSQCYLLDAEGNVVENWKRDFSGPASNYSMFYFGVNGLNKYVDADYTLVIPEGLMGDPTWYYADYTGGRANPELRYDFNPWKLAGEPRENFTQYDLVPLSYYSEVNEIRVNGKKQLEMQLYMDFGQPVVTNANVQNLCSVWYGEGNRLDDSQVNIGVVEDNPSVVMVGIRNIDFNQSETYTVSLWKGAIGTPEWAGDDYYSGHSNEPITIDINPTVTNVTTLPSEYDNNAPVYNIHGMRLNPDDLQPGIYIRNGKKVLIK